MRCEKCGVPAVATMHRGDAALSFCGHHLAEHDMALVEQGWSFAASETTAVEPAPSEPSETSEIIDGYLVKQTFDADGLLDDHDGVAAYRVFTDDGVLVDLRHFDHGLATDVGGEAARMSYDFDRFNRRYLSRVEHMVDGQRCNVITRSQRTAYAVVELDAHGNALRIESWIDGQFDCVVDPSVLPSA